MRQVKGEKDARAMYEQMRRQTFTCSASPKFVLKSVWLWRSIPAYRDLLVMSDAQAAPVAHTLDIISSFRVPESMVKPHQ
jgi:hypothetical protein